MYKPTRLVFFSLNGLDEQIVQSNSPWLALRPSSTGGRCVASIIHSPLAGPRLRRPRIHVVGLSPDIKGWNLSNESPLGGGGSVGGNISLGIVSPLTLPPVSETSGG